ncbi:MAG: phenylalanine--tRNA ligase subunit beta [Bacteroidetes bacterium]|nr:phenylalanine--tRNA ligase subunit beta [Bacteroidota bacterium]
MKISYNWLKTLIDVKDVSPQEIAQHLTDCGLEVESSETFESIKGMLKGVVIGHVLEKQKHPNADKLSLTKVDIGNHTVLSIVCGAPNVEAGQKVLVATVGSVLHTTSGEVIEIKKSKIRGEASEGMICAEDELGLGNSHAGIMVLPADSMVGTPAATYLNLYTDTVFEIGLTPNRGDAASHLGVARDLAAALNTKNKTQTYQVALKGIQELPPASGILSIEVQLENTQHCKRYSGITLSGLTVAPSPQWLKNYLSAIGIRPINNIVDCTNFVLHELGQPLHAFDAFAIEGKQIKIRSAKEGEKITTLDGTARTLKNSDLVIAHAQEPMCIAGVFGGLHSGVTEKTTAVFLESAYFDAAAIRKTAKHLSLKTDSSFRYERGTDPEITVVALTRAAHLILELAGGQVSSPLVDIYPEKIEPYKVAFSYANCDALIGKAIDRALIKNILQSLGIGIITEGADGLLLHVPRYKYDVTREADVIEEILRIYGMNNIEMSGKISFSSINLKTEVRFKVDGEIARALVTQGFYEAMSTSLTKSSYVQNYTHAVPMLNPLSNDLSALRPTMLYGLLEAVAHNLNHKTVDIKLFELGKIYRKKETGDFPYEEEKQVALVISGKQQAANYHQPKPPLVDFYTLKAYVETVFLRLGIAYKTQNASHEHLTDSYQYLSGKKVLATIGQVNKELLKKMDIQQPVFYAELYAEPLYSLAFKPIVYKEPSKFPSVKRDLALLLDKHITYAELEKIAFEAERNLLQEVSLFDVYEGDKIPNNKKSYALSFTLQNAQATLTDQQITNTMNKLTRVFEEKLQALIRS